MGFPNNNNNIMNHKSNMYFYYDEGGGRWKANPILSLSYISMRGSNTLIKLALNPLMHLTPTSYVISLSASAKNHKYDRVNLFLN